MKEENGSQDIGATAFDYPNSSNPKPHSPIYYGNQYVPHPTNSAAKNTSKSEVMSAVLRGK